MPEGGTILLGVDERSGFRVTGVPDPAQLEKVLLPYVETRWTQLRKSHSHILKRMEKT